MKGKIMLAVVAIIISTVSYCRIHRSEDLDALLLENVEALANDEFVDTVHCYYFGSVDCPITEIKVKLVYAPFSL